MAAGGIKCRLSKIKAIKRGLAVTIQVWPSCRECRFVSDSFWVCVECILEKVTWVIFGAASVLAMFGGAMLILIVVHPELAYEYMDKVSRFILNNV